MAKITQNAPTCDVHPENLKPKTKNFLFDFDCKERFVASVEGLNSSLALEAGKL